MKKTIIASIIIITLALIDFAASKASGLPFNLIHIAILAAYFIGSIPFGLILTKIFTGVDIRTIGSGNIGATNVLRTGNKWLAALTLALDLLKGFVAIKLFQNSLSPDQIYFIGGAVVMGHIESCWLNFKGGKGIATFLGVLLALNWVIAVIALTIWLCVFKVSKYSSLAAITATATLPIISIFMVNRNFALFTLTLGIIIIYKHKDNIIRLWNGNESKIGKHVSNNQP